MKTKEQIKKNIDWQRERIYHSTKECELIASRFAALISHVERKMPKKDAEWCKKWILDLMEAVDHLLESQHHDNDLFEYIYGIDRYELRFAGLEPEMHEIEEMLKPYWRAVQTFGEVKLSIRPDDVIYDHDADIETNLSMIRLLNDDHSRNG